MQAKNPLKLRFKIVQLNSKRNTLKLDLAIQKEFFGTFLSKGFKGKSFEISLKYVRWKKSFETYARKRNPLKLVQAKKSFKTCARKRNPLKLVQTKNPSNLVREKEILWNLFKQKKSFKTCANPLKLMQAKNPSKLVQEN